MKREVSNETKKRLDILHRNHYGWLYAVGFKVSKSKDVTEDLIQELYVYLSERDSADLYYKDSFNLQYCRTFILSRFYNLIKVENRWSEIPLNYDEEDRPYDIEHDLKIEEGYNDLIKELDKMKKMKGWSSAMLAEMYWLGNMTFEQLSNEIGISKSTAFLNVRKVKERLKENLKNPFKNGTTED